MRYDRRSTRLWVASLFLSALAISPSSAVDVAKDLSIMQTLGGEVLRSEWSNDGENLVYLVDLDFDGTLELRSVESDNPGTEGGVLLAELTPPSSTVPNFLISPDSQTVVYRAYGAVELWSVPITGGTSTPLSASGDTVRSFAVTPDSTTVGFSVRPDIGSDVLLTVPIGGGAPSPVDTPTDGSFRLLSIRFTPDSSRTVYSGAVADATLNVALWSAPLDGDPLSELSGVVLSEQRIPFFEISPDGSRVLFGVSDSESITLIEAVYSIPTAGGTKVLLASGLYDAKIRGDGTSVLIVSTNFDLSELSFLTKPIDGGGSTLLTSHSGSVDLGDHTVRKLSPPPVPGQTIDFDLIENWTGPRAVFTVEVGAQTDLWSAPLSGATEENPLVRLNPPDHDVGAFAPVPAGGFFAVYVADDIIYRVRLVGGPPQELASTGAGIADLLVSPNGSLVVFRGVEPGTSDLEAFSVPITGGTPVQLTNVLASDGDVDALEISPDSSTVLVIVNGTLRLIPIDGSDFGDFLGFGAWWSFTPDGQTLVWLVRIGNPGVVARDVSTGVETVLHDFSGQPGSLQDGVLAGDRFVYVARVGGNNPATTIFSAPLDGSGPTVLHGAPTFDPGDVLDFAVSPDGETVLFRRLEAGEGESVVLVSVPTHGGDAVEIPGTTGTEVYGTTPNGSQIVHGGPDGLFAQFASGSTPIPLTPPDFGAELLPGLLLEADAAYFRAVVHPEHTSLFTSTLTGVFGDGFEGGDTARWTTTVGGLPGT